MSETQEKWNSYLEKQLKHLVLECAFDFEEISRKMGKIGGFDVEFLRKKWLEIHNKRKNVPTSSTRLNELMNRLHKKQNLQDLLDALPKKKREEKDFLKVEWEGEEVAKDKWMEFIMEGEEEVVREKEEEGEKKVEMMEFWVKKEKGKEVRKEKGENMKIEFIEEIVEKNERKIEKNEEKIGKNEEIIEKKVEKNEKNEEIIKKNEEKIEIIEKKEEKIEIIEQIIEKKEEIIEIDDFEDILEKKKEEIENFDINLEKNKEKDIEKIVEKEDDEAGNEENLKIFERGKGDEVIKALEEIEFYPFSGDNFVEKKLEKNEGISTNEEKKENRVKFLVDMEINKLNKVKTKESSSEEEESDEESFLYEQQKVIKKDVATDDIDMKEKENAEKNEEKIEKKERKVKKKKEKMHPLENYFKKAKKQDLEIEKNPQTLELTAGKEFQKSIEIEEARKIEKEKQRAELKALTLKFQEDIAANKQRKKEQKKRELEEQAEKLGAVMKAAELAKRAAEQLAEREKELIREKEKDFEKKKEIERVRNAREKAIVNKGGFLLFDEILSYCEKVTSLPLEIKEKVEKDLKAFELSREGLTNRFQMFVLPWYDVVEYQQETLAYFLANSCFCKEKGFAFECLGIILAEENSEDFKGMPEYLLREDKTKSRCVFLLFDAHKGRGPEVLHKSIEREVRESGMLSEKSVQKVLKRHKVSLKGKKLCDIGILTKEMCSIREVFQESKSFNILPLEGNCNKEWEISVVIMNEYLFKKNEIAIGDEVSETEPSEISAAEKHREDLVAVLVKEIEEKGLQILGMKSICLSNKNYEEIKQYICRLANWKRNMLCVVIGGNNCGKKVRKVIGNDDIVLAKKLEPKSLNAIFAQKREESLLVFSGKTARKLAIYLFGGRLENINENTYDEFIKRSEKKDLLEKGFLFQNAVHQTVFSSERQFAFVLSPLFLAKDFGKIIKKIISRSAVVQQIRTIELKSQKNTKIYAQLCLENKKNHSSVCLEVLLTSASPKSLQKSLCKKLAQNYEMLSKDQLVFITESQKIIAMISENCSNFEIKATQCPAQGYYIAIWPVAVLGTAWFEIDFLLTAHELLGMCVCAVKDSNEFNGMLSEILSTNFVFSNQTLRSPTFKFFCSEISKNFSSKSLLIIALRQQHVYPKEFLENKCFSTSNTNLEEHLFHSLQKNWSSTKTEMLSERLSWLFCRCQNFEQLVSFARTAEISLYDDRSYPNSIVFDLPHKKIDKNLISVLVISQKTFNTLSRRTLLKRVEKQELFVRLLAEEVVMSNEFGGLLCKHSRECYEESVVLEKALEEVESGESVWSVLLLEGENAIFKTKQLASEISGLLSFENKEKEIAQLNLGIFCSLNYENSLLEINQINELILLQKNSLFSKMTSKDKEKLLVCLYFKENKEDSLSDILDEFQKNKLKIARSLILTELFEEEKDKISEFFSKGGKFDRFEIKRNLEFSKEGVFLFAEFVFENRAIVSDAFGSFSFKEVNKFSIKIKGDLIEKIKNSLSFLFYAVI